MLELDDRKKETDLIRVTKQKLEARQEKMPGGETGPPGSWNPATGLYKEYIPTG